MPSERNTQPGKKILVIGAYGFIGAHIARACVQNGQDIVALGRNQKIARKVGPSWNWLIKDLGKLKTAEDWTPLLEDIDFVVNCAGALQNTPTDDLETVHTTAISSLAEACQSTGTALIQLSAVGAKGSASTDFLTSKASGDEAIMKSKAEYWILRPGLVLAENAFGGTELLRMLAAIPFIQPIALPNAQIQSVAMEDLVQIVMEIFDGKIPSGAVVDVVEDEAHNLERVVLETRAWLGFPEPKFVLPVADALARWMARFADGLGKLGWRSPLRSNALLALSAGIIGDPKPLENLTDRSLGSLRQSYAGYSAHSAHRLKARTALLMPLLVATLFLFWLLSGTIALFQLQEAAEVLTNSGWPEPVARLSVIFWSIIDILLAAMLLYRPMARHACLAMIGVSLIYLISASIVVPTLWFDPLGPLVKIIPSIGLALTTYIFLEER